VNQLPTTFSSKLRNQKVVATVRLLTGIMARKTWLTFSMPTGGPHGFGLLQPPHWQLYTPACTLHAP
jgi:hypothetical protein